MKKYYILIILFISVVISVSAQFGEQQIISTEANSPRAIFAADFDGDGDMDVLSSSEDEIVAWYKNLDGLGNFGAQQIIDANMQGARGIYATDLDGDGDIDVIATAGSGDRVVWFRNTDGLGNFSSQNIITSATDGPLAVYATDIDNDGDMDILSASFMDNKIAWYENTDGLGAFGEQQIITTNALSARDVYAEDLDDDGDMDIIATSTASDEVLWFENLDGLGAFGTEQVITNNANGVLSVFAEDLDGDGDMDVLSAVFGDDIIAWYENTDGLGNFGTENIMTSNALAAKVVFASDLDNDGDIDVLSASEGDNKIAWYENTDGLGTFSTAQLITNNVESNRGVYAADLDNDGDMDVLSVSSQDDKLAWYENLTILGVDDNQSPKITFTPNPVTETLNIESNFGINKIQVYDLLGRLVLQENNPTSQIDVSNLASGLLFVHIETNEGVFTKKIIKE